MRAHPSATLEKIQLTVQGSPTSPYGGKGRAHMFVNVRVFQGRERASTCCTRSYSYRAYVARTCCTRSYGTRSYSIVLVQLSYVCHSCTRGCSYSFRTPCHTRSYSFRTPCHTRVSYSSLVRLALSYVPIPDLVTMTHHYDSSL